MPQKSKFLATSRGIVGIVDGSLLPAYTLRDWFLIYSSDNIKI
jgi:hypothetical protein